MEELVFGELLNALRIFSKSSWSLHLRAIAKSITKKTHGGGKNQIVHFVQIISEGAPTIEPIVRVEKIVISAFTLN